MAQRNVPNPVEQQSPIDVQEKGVVVNVGDAGDVYTLDLRRRVQIDVTSGQIEIKFFDSDDVELTPSLKLSSEDNTWTYDFALKQSAPSKIEVHPDGVSGSEYDILIEKV